MLLASELPPENQPPAIEAAVIDFKRWQDSKKRFESAKDVAAFANHLGGTLLIGADHNNGAITYVPMSASDAEAVQDCYSASVKARCSPRPVMDFTQFPVSGGVVVAVNVWPSVAQLIAVKAHADKKQNDGDPKPNEGYGGEAWVFPVRVGNHSIYIVPENAMYMLPDVRRKALLPQAIPKDVPITISFRFLTGGESGGSAAFQLLRVEEATNSVVFKQANTGAEVAYPLDQVELIYKAPNGWKLRFAPVS